MMVPSRVWMPAAALTGLAVCFSLAADSPVDQIVKLRNEWRAQVEKDIQSTRARYVDGLLALERELAGKGDYEGAVNVRRERRAIQGGSKDTEKTAPTVPGPAADGEPVVLAASAALVSGGVGYDAARGILRGWKSPNSGARWLLPPGLKGGGYEIELTWSCPPDGGGEMLIREDFHTLLRKVTPTAGWDAWQTEIVGTLRLLTNSRMLELTAAAVRGPGLCELKSVRLLPVSAGR